MKTSAFHLTTLTAAAQQGGQDRVDKTPEARAFDDSHMASMKQLGVVE